MSKEQPVRTIFIRVLLIVLSVLTGALFLYSAYTKATPIQVFEYTMVDFLHLPWLVAGIAARFFIGLEAGLGLLIMGHLHGKNNWVLKLSISLIAVFSVYIIYLWARFGSSVNCGCFGDNLLLTPAESLLKNGVLLAVLVLIYKYAMPIKYRWKSVLTGFILVACLVLPFILFVLPVDGVTWTGRPDRSIDLKSLYSGDKDTPAEDLTKGKHVIALFSQSCPHCRLAAYKLHLMKESNPSLPFFMVIGGTSNLGDFWEKTRAINVPYSRLNKNDFLKITRGIFPTILMVDDGRVVATVDYYGLSQSTLEKWVNGQPINTNSR